MAQILLQQTGTGDGELTWKSRRMFNEIGKQSLSVSCNFSTLFTLIPIFHIAHNFHITHNFHININFHIAHNLEEEEGAMLG